jgi:hypothetical protein
MVLDTLATFGWRLASRDPTVEPNQTEHADEFLVWHDETAPAWSASGVLDALDAADLCLEPDPAGSAVTTILLGLRPGETL